MRYTRVIWGCKNIFLSLAWGLHFPGVTVVGGVRRDRSQDDEKRERQQQ